MDWSKADPQMAERVVREGESYLSGQLQLATSADQRAAVLAGVFAASGTAVLAGLIALTASDLRISEVYPIYLGGFAAVAMLLGAAALCISAIFPVGFWLPGNEPKSWYRDIESGKKISDALGEEAEHIQEKIAENRNTTKNNAKRFKWGAMLGITAPVLGAAIWVIASSCRWLFWTI